MGQGKNASEAAAIAFGDLGKLQLQPEAYIRNSHYLEFKTEAPPVPPDATLKARALSDAEADAYRGGFEVIRGKPEEAKPLLQQAVQLDPKLALAYQNLALAQLMTGQRPKASVSFVKAIELDPGNELTRYLRAQMALSDTHGRSENPQIEEDLHAAIAANPDFVPPYELLSLYLVNQIQKLPEALAFAQKAVSLEPENSGCQISLASALLALGKFDDAQLAGRRARAYARNSFEQAQAQQFLAVPQQFRSSTGAVSPSGVNRNAQKLELSAKEATGGPSSDEEAKIEEGTAGNIRCAGNELFLELNGDRKLTLHTRDFTHVPMETEVPFESGEFQLCKDLDGHKARVTYLPTEKKPYDGEIQFIELEE